MAEIINQKPVLEWSAIIRCAHISACGSKILGCFEQIKITCEDFRGWTGYSKGQLEHGLFVQCPNCQLNLYDKDMHWQISVSAMEDAHENYQKLKNRQHPKPNNF